MFVLALTGQTYILSESDDSHHIFVLALTFRSNILSDSNGSFIIFGLALTGPALYLDWL